MTSQTINWILYCSIEPIGVAAIFLFLLWASNRFRVSMRGLLIVTTLVAVGLGLAVYAARK